MINTNAPIKCATGQINGLSIGYDGDADFNLNATGILPLVNPFNEQGGTLGPPNGIVVELPPADRYSTSITPDGLPAYLTLQKLQVGDEMRVCGRWVTDTRDYWNELHPVTSMQLLPSFNVSAGPSDVTLLAGGKTSFTTTVTLNSGPDGATPIQLSVSGLPSGATASFSTNPVPLNNPSLLSGTSTLQINTTSSVALGDFPITISGTDQSGFAIQSTTVNLHVYDFSITSPTPLLVLQTGSNSYNVAANLLSGSSTTSLPAIGLTYSTLPSGITMSFTPNTGTPSFTSLLSITAAGAANNTYTITFTGTDSRVNVGGTRTDVVTLSVLSPQQAMQLIIDQINAFKAGSVLNNGQAGSLISKLNAVTNDLNSKPPDNPAACNVMNAFVNQVNSYVANGVLTQAQANLLLGGPLGITAIMVSIPC